MSEYLDEISTKTSVSDVSIIKEELPASETMNICRSAIGFVYNAMHDKEPDDEFFLQNVYFGIRDSKWSLFKIRFRGVDHSFTNEYSLSALNEFKENISNNIEMIETVGNGWKQKSYKIKKRYLLGLETILPNVFHIEDMPKLKPASIKIEKMNLDNLLYGNRNSGIYFKSLPKNVFDTLVDYNEQHHLGYKIYAK